MIVVVRIKNRIKLYGNGRRLQGQKSIQYGKGMSLEWHGRVRKATDGYIEPGEVTEELVEWTIWP